MTHKRIAGGVLFLDQTQPGWRDKIDIIKLDLSDPKTCVLGQLFEKEAEEKDSVGGFTLGTWKLRDWADENDIDFADLLEEDVDDDYELPQIATGFERDSVYEEYEPLARMWVEEIGRP